MKRKITLLSLSLGLLIMSSCSKTHYVSSNFENDTSNHKYIAVVPVKMIFSGNMPKNMTAEQIAEQELAESQAFQISLHNNILRSTKRGKKPFRVDFKSVDETNALLEKAGISILDSWDKDPKELAEILGVDAVVKATVDKKRYISDLASYGISVGVNVINSIPEVSPLPLPGNISKTNDVKASLSLVDKDTGTLLYSDRKLMEINWTRTPAEAVERINRRMTKRFPYRIPS